MENSGSSEFCALMDEMTAGISSVREAVKSLNDQRESLDTKDGISLLSLKHHALLSYLNSSVILSARRALGHSLASRSPPIQPFSAPDRPNRGNASGDLVDSMIETRIVLEKTQILETRMRYQIEKLVKLAREPEKTASTNDDLDPLSFRPNPQNLLTNKSRTGEDESGSEGGDVVDETDIPAQKAADADGIYRPPRIAPMPYTGMTMSSKSKSQLRKERPPVPSALSSLLADPSLPHAESTSGLGGSANVASQSSKRAAYLKRITEFEEENFSRLVMKKSEARQRARDEADLALGGNLGAIGGGRRRRVAGGLEDEFGDVLKSVERGSRGAGGVIRGDGYDELRNRGKKGSLIERSRKRDASFAEDGDESAGRTKKRSRFEHETKLAKKKLLKQRR